MPGLFLHKRLCCSPASSLATATSPYSYTVLVRDPCSSGRKMLGPARSQVSFDSLFHRVTHMHRRCARRAFVLYTNHVPDQGHRARRATFPVMTARDHRRERPGLPALTQPSREGPESISSMYSVCSGTVFPPGLGGVRRLSARHLLAIPHHLFLHGGWLHIIANMCVRLFTSSGTTSEDRMGPLRFLLFYLSGRGRPPILVHYTLSRDSTHARHRCVGSDRRRDGRLPAALAPGPHHHARSRC